MPLVIREIRLPLHEDEDELLQKAAKSLGILKKNIKKLKIVRQSIDARDKKDIHLKYSVLIWLQNAADEKRFAQINDVPYEEFESLKPIRQGTKPLALRPVIAGAGPAGLFCALRLSEYGFSPLIVEQGKDIDRRIADFEKLCSFGILNPKSNVCFGEGGAGAFSDGKLTTRIKDPRTAFVLEVLVEAGAPQDILYSAKPHMGTERIRSAIKKIREKIMANGGEVKFDTTLTGIKIADGKIKEILAENKGSTEKNRTDILVLATGHSARETFAMLHEEGVALQKKPFAIGLRIEHPREFIDRSQYGDFFDHPRLGAAEYRLTTRFENRGVYTFCMCPGGEVINSSTENGHFAVNGMSYYARNMQNSNSAVVVTVGTDDLKDDPLSGVEFQRQWEKRCFEISDGRGLPAQRLEDFYKNETGKGFGIVKPSIKPYARPSDLNICLPVFVADGIKKGVLDFARMIRGFDMPDAVLTGVEMRTSSPLTIPRGEDLTARGVEGLYPAGEGGGHAGGIVSAAVDGLKVAQAIIEKYKPCY